MAAEVLQVALVGALVLVPLFLLLFTVRSVLGTGRMWDEAARGTHAFRADDSVEEGGREAGHCPSCGRETDWEFDLCQHCAEPLPDR